MVVRCQSLGSETSCVPLDACLWILEMVVMFLGSGTSCVPLDACLWILGMVVVGLWDLFWDLGPRASLLTPVFG